MKIYNEPKITISLMMTEDIVRTSTGAFDNDNDNIFIWQENG